MSERKTPVAHDSGEEEIVLWFGAAVLVAVIGILLGQNIFLNATLSYRFFAFAIPIYILALAFRLIWHRTKVRYLILSVLAYITAGGALLALVLFYQWILQEAGWLR